MRWENGSFRSIAPIDRRSLLVGSTTDRHRQRGRAGTPAKCSAPKNCLCRSAPVHAATAATGVRAGARGRVRSVSRSGSGTVRGYPAGRRASRPHLVGIAAGGVPAGDQARLRRSYQFESFDQEFAAGIDLPHSYVENIDVVWKKEFRIGAAYEIENSTSIYSGLLRFADLNILAPNTLYPMFVVAPSERKNRVREQLRRPTLEQLGCWVRSLLLCRR